MKVYGFVFEYVLGEFYVYVFGVGGIYLFVFGMGINCFLNVSFIILI